MFNIGITLGFPDYDKNIEMWSNGARQNIIYLYLTLKQCKNVNKCYIVNVGGKKIKDYEKIDFNPDELDVVEWDEIKDNLDIVIQLGMQLGDDKVNFLKSKNKKIISYVCGNMYVINTEHMLYLNEKSQPFIETNVFDEVWTNAQHLNTNKHYLETLYRASVKVCPHIWNPYLIEKLKSEERNKNLIFEYNNINPKKRIGVFEPNINVVKTSFYPMMICERLYNFRPELFENIMITNTLFKKEDRNFLYLALSLDITKNIATYENRYVLPEFLANYTDIIVSHQWENGLNYMYYDVFYLKYPFVHNSEFFKEYGYYYPNFDVEKGYKQLENSILNHDKNIEIYNKKCEEVCWKHHTDNPKNIKEYEVLIGNLMKKNIKIDDIHSNPYYNSKINYSNIINYLNKIEIEFDDNDLILDVGCGNGLTSNKISDFYKIKIDCLDYSYKRIEYAKEYSENKYCNFILEDINNYIKKCKKKYNVIYLFDTLEYLNDDIILKLNKLLSDDGFILSNSNNNLNPDEIYNLEENHNLYKWNKTN